MTNRKLRRTLSICAVLLVTTIVGGFVTTSLANQVSQITANAVYLPLVLSEKLGKIYLPLVNNRAPFVTNFGVQTDPPISNPRLLTSLNVEWIRLNGPSWSEVQTTDGGEYNWDVESVRKFDRALARMQQVGVSPRVIMNISGSPDWSTTNGSTCEPIKPDHYDDFAAFTRTLAQRYPSVKYFELGNEPDVDAEDVQLNSGFGCWGDKADTEYYGGRPYGDMLKVVYPAIKGVNASIQVLNGGLLLNRPYVAGNNDTLSARFIEGVFAAGAGASFDILTYHSYTYFIPANPTPDGTTTIGYLNKDWKVPYLREIMQRYGVAEKPLMNTEGALLCQVNASQLDACHDAQASLIGRMYARAARDRVSAVIWYTLDSDSFYSTALVAPTGSASRPGYDAFKHAGAMLGRAEYLGTLDNQPEGVEGYRFQSSGLSVTVFWSDQGGKSVTIPVPSGKTPSCTDRVGAKIDCSNVGGVVTLGASSQPIYVAIP